MNPSLNNSGDCPIALEHGLRDHTLEPSNVQARQLGDDEMEDFSIYPFIFVSILHFSF